SHLTVVLGGACLPHVTMRMYTASSARQVRRSMTWAVSTVALFVLVLTVVGFGATAMIGRETIAGVDPQGNTAYLLGSQAAFGAEVSTAETFLFTTVTTAVFLTLLASVAGMILACANSLAHDVFASRVREMSARREMTVARLSDRAPPAGPRRRRPGHPQRHAGAAPQPPPADLAGARPRRRRHRPRPRLQPLLAPLHPHRPARHPHRRHPRRPAAHAGHQPRRRITRVRLPRGRLHLAAAHHPRHPHRPHRLRLRLARHPRLRPRPLRGTPPPVRGGRGLDPRRRRPPQELNPRRRKRRPGPVGTLRPGPARPTSGAAPHSSPSHICSSSTDHQLSGEPSAAGSSAASCAWKSTVQRPACSWFSPNRSRHI